MKLRHCLLAVFLAASAQASASLQSLDWKTNGDGLITLDTSNGIGWLDLSQTGGKSIDEALQLTQSGQRYAGWRMATLFEVHSLHSNYFGTPFDGFSLFSKPGLWSDRADLFLSYFGYSKSSGDASNYLRYSYGMYISDSGSFYAAGVRREYSYIDGINRTYWNVGQRSDILQTSYVNPDLGVYLVRDNVEAWLATPVSSPAAPFALALMFIGMFVRKAKIFV